MTNWFDPESPVVRSILIAVMLASLFMAIAIPEAFGDRALLFAASYAGLQIVRNAFAVIGSPPDWPLRPALKRILHLVARGRRPVDRRGRSSEERR